jgi:DNA-binding HxlR family transcriptional regulator
LRENPRQKDWIRTATRYRYGLPVLAELSRDHGCKFVTLMRRLEASDRAIRQALDHLISVGWVMKNPGYGHPLRPEYILTSEGDLVGKEALAGWQGLCDWGEQEVALERWPLAILGAVTAGARRFGQVQRLCEGISPRALALGLVKLEDSGLVVRSLVEGRPPKAEYLATRWGQELEAKIRG